MVDRPQNTWGGYVTGAGAKSLTEQVLNRMTDSRESAYYTANSVEHTLPTSPTSPLNQHIYVKEREMYEYREFNSSPNPYRPKSPLSSTGAQKPPTSSGQPFSPTTSPTNISYHQPEEQ
ncbi:unnamed protein product, partial [Oppiella nova]